MSIDQHIEELHAELELALVEREVMLAEAYGEITAEPPF